MLAHRELDPTDIRARLAWIAESLYHLADIERAKTDKKARALLVVMRDRMKRNG